MTTPKETYEYCEQLIQKEIDEVFVDISKWGKECADHNEEFISLKERFISFKERRSSDLKELYKHLENLKSMKTSYLSGR